MQQYTQEHRQQRPPEQTREQTPGHARQPARPELQQKARQKVRQQTRQHTILDHLSTGVMTLDSSLQVTALNASGEAMLQASQARCLGQHAGRLVLQPTLWLSNLEQALASGNPHSARSVPLVLQSGQEIHVDITITPVDKTCDEVALVVEMLPVDRLLRISREEHSLHAYATSQAVIRGLAHEIKNPLGGVRGAAQLLARELPTADLAEYTRIIIREADRLRDLVDRLLGPDRQPECRPLNIHQVLENVRELLLAESERQVSIERDYDPSLPELPGDSDQLTQAVLNVMRNALQAASSHEDCRIILRSRAQRQFTIAGRRHRLVARVDIVDNGPGVPEELLPSIFAPMVTGRAEGTGLGLSIAQAIVSRHGGVIRCDSEAGATRFSLFLPLDEQHVR